MRHPEIQLGKWEFHQVMIEDKELYAQFTRKTSWPVNLWSANFPFIWAFSQYYPRKILWKLIDDLLVTFIFSKKKKLSLLCLPFGNGDVEHLMNVLYKSMLYCISWNRAKGFKTRGFKTKVRTINSCQLDYLQSSARFDKLFTLKKLRGIERHFSIYQLHALAGKQFNTIRKSVNKYYRKYPDIKIRKYQPGDYQKLLDFNKYWEETGGKKYATIFDKVYFNEIVKHYQELDMIVLVAEWNDEIVGVNIGGETLNGESWGCICKTKKTVEGLHEAIILKLVHELNRINNCIQHLNVGSDMGIEGLRRFKEKFKPVLNLERYSIFLRRN